MQKNTWWLSDCGQYVAHIWGDNSPLNIDVMSTTGPECWLGGRYVPNGGHDRDKRHTFPEFAHMVTSWSNGGPKAFSLGFQDMDQSVYIRPLTGNCVIKSYEARFSRPMNMRAKAKRKTVKT